MYLLDTHVISELRKIKPHGAVLAWLRSVADTDLHLCAITLGEIQAGIELTRAQDAGKAAEIEAWLDQVSATYNVLPLDGACLRMSARLMHRTSDALQEDAMIAACARVHRLTVVTRNLRDFRGFGVALINPFKVA